MKRAMVVGCSQFDVLAVKLLLTFSKKKTVFLIVQTDTLVQNSVTYVSGKNQTTI